MLRLLWDGVRTVLKTVCRQAYQGLGRYGTIFSYLRERIKRREE